MAGSALILGNGISRLLFDREIRLYPGEVWGCNRVFIEYGDLLARITGHVDVMEEAAEYRDEHGYHYRIFGGHVGRHRFEPFTCPRQFCRDSGTTLVAQALHEGYDVAACGFDLGGPDVLSPGLETQNKRSWVGRWRELLSFYGAHRVQFWGHDHKPYLLSGQSDRKYADRYLFGRPHIMSEGYLRVYRERMGDVDPLRYGGDMVRVRFVNGYESQLREAIAERLRDKGELVILGAVDEPKEAPAEKSEPEVTERKRGRPSGVSRK